jgi:hypothetical protein
MAIESEDQSREFSLKTAYVFHFAELVEWPESNLVAINICLQSTNRLARSIGILEGQTIGDASIHVITDYPKSLEGCQMLLVTSLDELTDSVQDHARQQHILLLSDQASFAAHGGMLEFNRRDDKLNLVVNIKAVKQAGLKISSKLLRMAQILE